MTREEKLQQFAEQTTKGLYLDRHNLIQMVKQGAKRADQHPHWIPVEERLPKETGWYLVATPTLNSKIDVAFWKGKWHRLITITHWMPIVPPRKEE